MYLNGYQGYRLIENQFQFARKGFVDKQAEAQTYPPIKYSVLHPKFLFFSTFSQKWKKSAFYIAF